MRPIYFRDILILDEVFLDYERAPDERSVSLRQLMERVNQRIERDHLRPDYCYPIHSLDSLMNSLSLWRALEVLAPPTEQRYLRIGPNGLRFWEDCGSRRWTEWPKQIDWEMNYVSES